VLKAMQKDLAPSEVRRAIKMARKAKIPSVTGNFMVGNWDESFLDVLKTWYFVLVNNVEPLFWICTPYPGTEFSRRLMAAGYLDSGYSWLIDFKPGTYTPLSRTNKLSKISITIVYFNSVLFQLVLMFFRGKHLDEFHFFTRRAINEARKKLVRR
jgi:radical SAM superfamily enzyme YgiQ (UPF0313 family)